MQAKIKIFAYSPLLKRNGYNRTILMEIKEKAKQRNREKRLKEIEKISIEWNNDLRKYLSRKIND